LERDDFRGGRERHLPQVTHACHPTRSNNKAAGVPAATKTSRILLSGAPRRINQSAAAKLSPVGRYLAHPAHVLGKRPSARMRASQHGKLVSLHAAQVDFRVSGQLRNTQQGMALGAVDDVASGASPV
jgi:hypothetical protein